MSVSSLVHPVMLESSHVVMECVIRNTLQEIFKELGVHIIDRLSSCLELHIVLVEVSMNLVEVAILLDRVLHKFMQVCSKNSDCGISIKSGQSHDGF